MHDFIIIICNLVWHLRTFNLAMSVGCLICCCKFWHIPTCCWARTPGQICHCAWHISKDFLYSQKRVVPTLPASSVQGPCALCNLEFRQCWIRSGTSLAVQSLPAFSGLPSGGAHCEREFLQLGTKARAAILHGMELAVGPAVLSETRSLQFPTAMSLQLRPSTANGDAPAGVRHCPLRLICNWAPAVPTTIGIVETVEVWQCMAVPTAICLQWWSGSANCDWEIALGARQCPLRLSACRFGTAFVSLQSRSGSAHCDCQFAGSAQLLSACSQSPAVPTAIVSFQVWPSSAHCADWEFAVGVRQCPLRFAVEARQRPLRCAVEAQQCPLRLLVCTWGPAVPTAIWFAHGRCKHSDSVCSLGPAVPTAIVSLQLVSGSVRRDSIWSWGPPVPTAIQFAVGARQCPLRCAVGDRPCPLRLSVCSWSPAVPTAIVSLQVRPGSAHRADWEFAVEARQCPLRFAVEARQLKPRFAVEVQQCPLRCAVEVWQCPLRLSVCSWCLAAPTAIQFAVEARHCPLRFAVEVRQCPLRVCSWSLTVPTAMQFAVEIRRVHCDLQLRPGSAHCDG